MSTSPPTEEHEAADELPKKRRWVRLAVIFVVVLAVAFVVALAAGAISNHSSSGTPPNASSAASSGEEGCTSTLANAEVRVTIYGNGESGCDEFNKGAAKSSGEFWSTTPQGSELRGDLVCSMSKGGLLIEVRDTGEHLNGNHICAGLTAQDWTSKEGPGAQIERERNAEKSQREENEAAAQKAQNEVEAAKRQKEQSKLEAEEAHEAAKQHKENEEQAAKSAQELRKSEAENRAQDKKNEEETKKDELESKEPLEH